jgi:hypothetical protein
MLLHVAAAGQEELLTCGHHACRGERELTQHIALEALRSGNSRRDRHDVLDRRQCRIAGLLTGRPIVPSGVRRDRDGEHGNQRNHPDGSSHLVLLGRTRVGLQRPTLVSTLVLDLLAVADFALVDAE